MFSAETLPPVPEDFVGNVNCVDFWEDLSTELCSKAFLQGKCLSQLYMDYSVLVGFSLNFVH